MPESMQATISPVPGSPTYLTALLASIQTLHPTLPVDPVVLQSLLLSLISRLPKPPGQERRRRHRVLNVRASRRCRCSRRNRTSGPNQIRKRVKIASRKLKLRAVLLRDTLVVGVRPPLILVP